VPQFLDAVSFLYLGSNRLQFGVAPDAIDPSRVAVLRGKVVHPDGAPLAGGIVNVLGRPELGYTYTRSDGAYDLVANGGSLIQLEIRQEGFLTAQRQVTPPWNDYASLPDVILVPLDPQATVVPMQSADLQVSRGTPAVDGAGTRQATVIFPAGTAAGMTLPNGTSQALTSATVRLTEYTVYGANAMPGNLPPTTAVTYAVEMSIDEALAAGATRVEFNQPVPFYVENFLRFPVGGRVPSGYYDRTSGMWVPANDGRVIKVLSVAAGLASLDVDGSGVAADATKLGALGISDAERARLATLYQAGQELWRVCVDHFTPFDFNWPWGCATTCTPPSVPLPSEGQPDSCSHSVSGSKIDCESQVLGGERTVTGTEYSLHYQSERVPGGSFQRTLGVWLTGGAVPPGLKQITLTLTAAGRTFRETIGPPFTPYQSYTFIWDGKDAYGRNVPGLVSVSGEIGYVYDSVYIAPSENHGNRSFSALSTTGVKFTVSNSPGSPYVIYQSLSARLGGAPQPAGLGGWTLSHHHAYDAAPGVLHLGTGQSIRAVELPASIATIAGGGSSTQDGIPATSAALSHNLWMAFTPSGELLMSTYNRIRKVDRAGVITTIAGGPNCVEDAEGVPATEACFGAYQIAVGADGSVYIPDWHIGPSASYVSRILKVTPDGIVHRFAGTGTAGYTGDGGPATQAKVDVPIPSVAVGRDGSVYILTGHRVRRVDPGGVISTVAGRDGFCSPTGGDGQPAINASFCADGQLRVGDDGSIFVADPINARIRRITPDGIIQTVAGASYYTRPSGDGGPAMAAGIAGVSGLALGRDGSLFLGALWRDTSGAFTDSRVRRIWPDGYITSLAGGAPAGYSGDGIAANALLNTPQSLAVAPDGTLYVADAGNGRVRIVRPVLPTRRGDDLIVPSSEGTEAYVFDIEGRHLRTASAMDGRTLRSFGYGAAGLLETITDENGLVTLIERDGGGAPIAIVAPHGQRTSLSLDANGYLATVTNPAGEVQAYSYDPGGLMQSYMDPRGNLHAFAFDAVGRLLSDSNPAGGVKTLTRSEAANEYSVSLSTALDAERSTATTYSVQLLGSRERKMVEAAPDGTQTTTLVGTDGLVTVTYPDGTVAKSSPGSDPRFGVMSPVYTTTTTLPSGLQAVVASTRTAQMSNPADPFSATRLTETVKVNGRASSSTYTASTRQVTTTTAGGRMTVAQLDEKGRVVHVEPPGYPAVYAIDKSYDALGRLQAMGQGSRATTITYDTNGLPSTLLDPLNQTTRLTYDAVGRTSTLELPGSRLTVFGYDASGNLTSLTPPGRTAHGFVFDAVDRLKEYDPPLLPGLSTVSTSYTYSRNGDPLGMWLPDGTSALASYEVGTAGQLTGRIASVTDARGTASTTYDGAGRVATLTTPEGQSLAYSYDGFLVTGETSTGQVQGSIAYGYNSDFRVTSLGADGISASFAYDPDGLLTLAGAETITRDPASGRLSGTSLGAVTTATSYNGYGEVASFSATVNGSPVFSWDLGRDPSGRIVSKTDHFTGATTSCDYGYDTSGRLSDVTMNGQLQATYLFDVNGNLQLRTSLASGVEEGVTDGEDRMRSFGATTYSYGPNGDLTAKTTAGATTTYSYDRQGNLLWATLPDGRRIDYVVDGRNRRVGKKVNGALVEGFLYDGKLRPVAWLDGAGAVKATFVYGLHVNVPEYMTTSAGTFRILTDHLGSPRLVVHTASGAVAQRMDYDSYGMVLADTAPGFQPFGFVGGLFDRDTELVRFGARDYDPSIGRWANKDPIRFAGGATNLYEYVGNDPVNLTDPEGTAPFAWLIRLLNNGERRLIRPLATEAEAVAARKAGQNVVFETRQSAKAAEKAAGGGCGDMMRHTGHELPNGEVGAPHYQTEGAPGHSFWGNVADILELFLPPIYLPMPPPTEI